MSQNAQDNEVTIFKRFKQWAKENLGTLAVVGVSVAGIITTIVMGARSDIRRGARATSSFAKTLAKIGEKVGPVLGGLLNLAAKILTLGAKSVEFLSKNLWLLAVIITYALYEKYKSGTNK